MGIFVLPALTVLGIEVVFLEGLDPAGRLFLEVLKTHEPVSRGVVVAQVELLSVKVLMEVYQCLHDGQ
jgi:hypothetical protein